MAKHQYWIYLLATIRTPQPLEFLSLDYPLNTFITTSGANMTPHDESGLETINPR